MIAVGFGGFLGSVPGLKPRAWPAFHTVESAYVVDACDCYCWSPGTLGESSLLNALVGKRISIVQDMPGVTRDRVSIPYQIDGKWVEIVDTGGHGFVDEAEGMTEHIQQQIDIAMTRCKLVLFVVDCQAGLIRSRGRADRDASTPSGASKRC